MSDRAPAQVRIVWFPSATEETRALVVGLINEMGMNEQTWDAMPGEWHTADDIRLGAPEELWYEMISRTTEEQRATFALWAYQDPKYEIDGYTVIWVPTLGLFEGACDTEGYPYLTYYIWLSLTHRPGGVGDYDYLLGGPWIRWFADAEANLIEMMESTCQRIGCERPRDMRLGSEYCLDHHEESEAQRDPKEPLNPDADYEDEVLGWPL